MSLRTFLIAGACAMLAAPAIHAADFQVGDLHIEGPWARATAPGQTMGAGYLSITNKGSSDDALVAAESPSAEKTEIHEVTTQDQMVKMSAIDTLPIPAGQTVELAPKGYHLMFLRIKQPFTEGETVPVTLRFSKAGTIDVPLQVRSLTYGGGDAHSHGGGHHHH